MNYIHDSDVPMIKKEPIWDSFNQSYIPKTAYDETAMSNSSNLEIKPEITGYDTDDDIPDLDCVYEDLPKIGENSHFVFIKEEPP